MRIGVLSVQGAFEEHIKVMEELGAECVELRQKKDIAGEFDGLILPGGEITVQGKLLRDLHMIAPLRDRIREGLPVLGTCAGLILLAEKIVDEEHTYLGTLPVRVKRNAYGRQLGSFHTEQEMKGIGTVPMTFIRAPYVEAAGDGVDTLASVDGKIAAVRYVNQIGIAFHPELDADDRIHKLFLSLCGE